MSNQKSRLAKVVHLADGPYVHVGDFQRALLDDDFMRECMKLIVTAKHYNEPPEMAVRRAIAYALNEVTGENNKARVRRAIKQIVIGEEPPLANGEKKS